MSMGMSRSSGRGSRASKTKATPGASYVDRVSRVRLSGIASMVRFDWFGDTSSAGSYQLMLLMLMHGMITLSKVEFLGRPLLLKTWRHPFPVKEVPLAETDVGSAHARLAYPAASLRYCCL